MRKAIFSTLSITAFRVVWLAVAFISQIVIAGFFGAKSGMDAFIAANTLPQYIITVLMGSLGFVFIPAFIDYKAKGCQDEAWGLASNMINLCLLLFGVITIAGLIFARPILQLITPGLGPEAIEIGTRISIIVWPTVLLTAMMTLLSSIYQAQGRFFWQAAVPVIGALVNLGMLVLLARWWGVVGLAVATTASILIQVGLLVKVISGPGKYRLGLNWRDPGIQQVFRLFLPLVIVGFFTKFTPLVERYLASGLGEGSISHLNYAFRFMSVAAILISSGISTVIFPMMSRNVSSEDMGALKNTMSISLRMMWFCIAPIIAIGFSLCLPLIAIFFQHGEFDFKDTLAVAGILRIYLFALIGICLANVTGRGFYVLKDTKTVAIVGIFESILYVIYTVFLARLLGVIGIVIAYAIYSNASLLWQSLILRFKTGNSGGRGITVSFIKTAMAAVITAIVTYLVTSAIKTGLMQLIFGGLTGMAVYLAVLHLTGSREIKVIWGQIRSFLSSEDNDRILANQ